MQIKITKPVGFSEIGGRSNNEDAIYPLLNEANETTQLFVVCDGMGGHSNGEIASRITSLGFAHYLSRHPEINTPNSKRDIYNGWNQALIEIEQQFENYILNNPESKGMGTTLCFCHFHSQGITLGHVGDSRIYQVRGNQIIYKSEDHSMVNELLRNNQITPEQAANYPNKNVITRAIQGAKTPTQIEFDLINDIKVGDIFFMCTDGVLEQINDRALIEILSISDFSTKDKINKIIERCQDVTKDNFSGYLIEVSEIFGNPAFVEEEGMVYTIQPSEAETQKEENNELALPISVSTETANIKNRTSTKTALRKSKDVLVGLGYALGGLIILFLGWITYDELMVRKDKPKEKPSRIKPIKPIENREKPNQKEIIPQKEEKVEVSSPTKPLTKTIRKNKVDKKEAPAGISDKTNQNRVSTTSPVLNNIPNIDNKTTTTPSSEKTPAKKQNDKGGIQR